MTMNNIHQSLVWRQQGTIWRNTLKCSATSLPSLEVATLPLGTGRLIAAYYGAGRVTGRVTATFEAGSLTGVFRA